MGCCGERSSTGERRIVLCQPARAERLLESIDAGFGAAVGGGVRERGTGSPPVVKAVP